MLIVKTDESVPERRKRARRILAALRRTYGEVGCALHHDSALELLIATMLSAQCTDDRVNKITPGLFKKYRSARDFAQADPETLEREIHSTGFFRQKTKSIQGASRMIVEHHDGGVPDSMDGLVGLPGVARKTANVVLGTWFGRNDGIVVDTHVGRLAERLALTWTSKTSKDAVTIESDLTELVPRKQWTYFSHAVICHGRAICVARRPKCNACAVAKHCPSAGTFPDVAPTGTGARGRRPAKAPGDG